MIEIGTLIRDCENIGLVVDHWIHDVSGELHIVVKWLTGRYEGELDAIWSDDLEIICK